ncbi:MAG: TIM barrel protein [Clostridia bacterium]|nr:TIM barrel protein [Clostridia bacterium]
MIKFGPSGNSLRFYQEGYKSTVDAPLWLANQGLNIYEYSFGRGINISDAKANEIAQKAVENGVEITVHAPYYINLANPSDEMAEKSYQYIINSALKARAFGGKRIVFHPSTVGKMTREDAVALTQKRMEILAGLIVKNNLDDMIFCPETMGKINQIGTVEEVTEFCKVADFFIPTVDFGHINARTQGSLVTQEDYERLIVHIIENLGFERAKNLHVHFSKIQYSTGGEVRHLTFADNIYGPDFEPLARAFKKYNMEPYIICESDGTQADDAIEMKRIYESIL